MSLSQIHQDILPNHEFPRVIVLRRVSADDAARRLSQFYRDDCRKSVDRFKVQYWITQWCEMLPMINNI
jgi:hypothetical protein